MKKFKILFVGLLVLIIVILLLLFFVKPEYSKDNVISLMNDNRDIPNNIYIKIEISSTDPKWDNHIEEIYKKDSKIYTTESTNSNTNISETLWDLENKSEVVVDNQLKQMYTKSIEGEETINPVSSVIFDVATTLKNTIKKYKYCGIENNILKISLSDDYGLTYYYIDMQNKELIKIEDGTNFDNKFELQNTTTYTYSYNTVTDEDVLKFDSNNYQDYTVPNEKSYE